MAVFQRLKGVTHAMAHTSPTASPDMRSIWQCKKNNSPRGRWGCSWSLVCYSCFPGPGKGFWETKYKLELTKPVPEPRRNHSPSLRNTEGVSEQLFSSLFVLSASTAIETIPYPSLTANQIAWRLSGVCAGPESFNWQMKTHFARFQGKCNGRKCFQDE